MLDIQTKNNERSTNCKNVVLETYFFERQSFKQKRISTKTTITFFRHIIREKILECDNISGKIVGNSCRGKKTDWICKRHKQSYDFIKLWTNCKKSGR